MKRVLILNHYHILSPRIQQEIQTLKKNGYEVFILNWIREEKHNYSKNAQEDGIVLKLPKNTIFSLIYLPIAYAKFSLKIYKISFDIIHCTHLILLPLAILWKHFKKTKVIYDAYEFYLLETTNRLPRGLKFIGNIFKKCENFLLKKIDGILTIDSDKNFLEKKYKKYNKNTAVIYNVPQKYFLDEKKLEDLRNKYKNKKIVLYIGGISAAKGVFKILEAANVVKEKIPDILFMLIGIFHDNPKIFWQKVKEYKLEQNIKFIPWLPYEEMLYYVAISKIGLALHQPLSKFYLLGKGNGRKIFTYMQFGLPVIAPKFGNIGKIVEEEKCGILVDTTNSQEIARAIIDLIKNPEKAQNMGKNGRKAIEEKYNWQIEEKKIIKIYENLYK
ncbi:MAG: Glycosyltransferase involved in cell wall bisynthesis [Thermodesulfobacteria bacterium]|nr:glycosyltransferase family 4 protein [Thermodesulfobacteriota bacterium]MCU4138626.1 Glycosyltransferase involved in cell wall bisynthesis [Thermodesulfobacteriota bacterium]